MSIQDAFRDGYTQGEGQNSYLWSSSMWEAFALGQHFRKIGRSYDLIKASRGSSYKDTVGNTFRVLYTKGAKYSIYKAA